MAASTKRIPCSELKVGDDLEFLGHLYRVTGFEPYTGPFDFIDRIACVRGHEDGFMSLEDTGWVDVAE